MAVHHAFIHEIYYNIGIAASKNEYFCILKYQNQIQLSMNGEKTCGSNNGRTFKLTSLSRLYSGIPRYLILSIFIITSVAAKAQAPANNTMMPDISYTYLQKLIDTAKKYYPRIQAFEHRVAASTANLKKSKLGWYDLFTFSFLYSPNNSTTLVNPSILNGYQLGVFFNLGSLLQKPSLVKQAKEELSVSQAERDEYFVNLTALVKQRYFLYVQQVAILKIRLQAETDAESNLQMIKHKFEKGEMTLDDYNKGLVNLADRTQSKIESEGSVLVAKSSLEELVGKKLEDIQ